MTNMFQYKNIFLGINKINESKDIILILPGGGYQALSNRESWPVANKFNTLGYNTCVLYYRISPCEAFAPFEDGMDALEFLSKDYDNIIACGFSAGGHLAGLLGTIGTKYNIKGMILCYADMCLDDPKNDTTYNFLQDKNTLEFRTKYSVDNLVDKNTVPAFLWTTKTDELVPYTYTLRVAEKLNEYGIYNECIIYPEGRHGLALANYDTLPGGLMSFYNEEVQGWVDKADMFIKKILNK